MSVDHAQLKTLMDIIGQDTLRRVKHSYVDDSQTKLVALKNAVEQHDMQQVEQLSHALKSSSSNLALATLAHIFAQLEAIGAQRAEGNLAQLYDDAECEYQHAIAELDSLI